MIMSVYAELLLHFGEESGKDSIDENRTCVGQNSFGYEFLALRLWWL